MPIIVKDYSWKQSMDKIVITVPLHGMQPSQVDIFTSARYIKASFANFFFELILLHQVIPTQIKCIKSNHEITFHLTKCMDGIWESLEVTNMSKQDRNELKRRLMQEEYERTQKESKEKVDKKVELKRIAVNEQIELDTRVRNRIENTKKMEETKALGDIDEWKESIEINKKNRSNLLDIIEDNENKKSVPIEDSKYNKKKENTIHSRKKCEKFDTIPKPRSTRSLQILFSPREFPTPCRESRLEEENEFLRKQAEARRAAGFVDSDLRPEEKNPQYLLAKGREFVKNNNFLGAISAFSFGIKLNPKFVDLYLARSEVHLTVGNFNRAIEDCTSALDLLKPALPINLDDRALCVGRRGMALFKLGFVKQGISELEQSLKLRKNESFEEQLQEFKTEYEEMKQKQECLNKTNETTKTSC